MQTAEELLAAAREAANSGHHQRAKAMLEKARRRTDEVRSLAVIDATLAYVVAEMGNLAEGFALCETALEQAVDRESAGYVVGQRGLLRIISGESQLAIIDLTRAIDDIAENTDAVARAHLNRGNVFLQTGDLVGALADFDHAARIYAQLGVPIEGAMAESNLGYARMLLGDIVGALAALDSAARVLAPLSPVSRAVGQQDRAEALIAGGMIADGVAALENAIAAFGSRRMGQMQGEAELVLARTLVLDDPPRARVVARRASRRFRKRGSETWALRADGIALRAEVETGSRRRDLPMRTRELASALRDVCMAHEAVPLELAGVRAAVRTGAVASAQVRLAQIRTGPTTPIATRLLAREVRAEVAVARGRRSRALDHVRRGLGELHAWQSSFGSLDLQTSLVGHGRRLAFAGIALALADGRPDLVLEWSERARSLLSQVIPVRPPADAEVAADLATLRSMRTNDDGTEPSAREAELRERIRRHGWRGEGSGEVREPASADEIRGQLAADDAVLLAYLYSDDRLHALALTASDARVVDLGPYDAVRELLDGMQADLDVAASTLSPMLRDVVDTALRERANRLDALLAAPLADIVGDHRVVVTPTGSLAGMPWTLLPTLSGRPLTVPQTATDWVAARRTARPLVTAGLVAGPHVDRAETEVRGAARAWADARTLTGADATCDAAAALAEGVDVLHVAAHGRHSADNPLFSAVELADGPLFGYDIDRIATVPPLVVLSACEVGRSTVRWGEELLGMTAAWQHAGTQCVVASPSSVGDELASEVLTRMHERMAKGVAPADALCEATAGAAHSPFLCFGTGW